MTFVDMLALWGAEPDDDHQGAMGGVRVVSEGYQPISNPHT
jgi:hypothetical protein